MHDLNLLTEGTEMTPKCPDCKRDQEDCICLCSEQQKQTIERQAAQIEMLRKALKFLSYMAQTTGNVMGKDAGLMDGIKAAEQALATTQDQALEQFAAKVREQIDVSIQTCGQCGRDLKNEIRAIKELPKMSTTL